LSTSGLNTTESTIFPNLPIRLRFNSIGYTVNMNSIGLSIRPFKETNMRQMSLAMDTVLKITCYLTFAMLSRKADDKRL